MESASGVLKIERAKRKDIKELVDLIYITEPEPQEEWGYGSEKEMKRNLRKLLSMRNNRFSIENIIVARRGKELVGMLLYLNGKDIDKLTRNSEKFIVKTQQGFFNKLGIIYSDIKDKLFCKECEEDEFYISNLAIKKEFRGNGYSEIMIEKAYEMARQKGYRKAALLAKNEKLIEFYEKIGFILVNKRIRRMVTSI